MKQMRLLFGRRRLYQLGGAALAAVLAAGLWCAIRSPQPAGAPPPSPEGAASTAALTAGAKTPAAPAAAPTGGLRQWIAEYRETGAAGATDAQRQERLTRGAALAAVRRLHLLRLIREDPRQALAHALRFDEYQALPDEMRSQVERPFCAAASFSLLPICASASTAAPAAGHLALLSLPDGSTPAAFTFGQRLHLTSKRALPVSGIVLDGCAALNEGVFREVAIEERATVLEQFPAGQADLSRSFATGLPLNGPGLLALAAGRVFAFSGPEELAQLDSALAALDSRPGPDSGSSLLVASAALPSSPNGAFNLAGVQAVAVQLASAWTETRKKVFIIRVDFADATGEPVAQASAAALLNGTVSSTLRSISYNKTWIEAGVSANVYRLPQTAAYYAGRSDSGYGNGSFSSLNAELLRDARNTFRNTRSGSDALCNIGPASTTGSGGDAGLGDFDIVGVFFDQIGEYAGGVAYAGLATIGGSDLWIQHYNDARIFVHEIGHNYGLGHSSLWISSGPSPIGGGVSDEYGDRFDIMGSGPVDRGYFHPQAKARLNWLTPTQWTDATTSATHRIYRIDSPDTAGTPRGVRITKASTPGASEYYWLGFRPAFGEYPAFTHGACLYWQRPGEDRSWLLDSTPGSAAGLADSPLSLGRTYADPAAGVYITPVAVGGEGADQYLDVRVNLGAFPGNRAPQAGSISGPATVAARTPVSFAATATDADADPLAYGWDTADGSSSDNSPTVTHSWSVGGTYPLSLTVSDMKGGTATAQRTVTVTDPLDTWTDRASAATSNLMEIVAGKGRLVTANYWGQISLSWDGITWNVVGSLPGFESQPQLAFGDHGFVLAGKKSGADAGQIGYSADGLHWQVATFPVGVPKINDVASNGATYLAVASSGAVLYSTDAATWSITTVPGLPDFRNVIWDGAAWLAVSAEAGANWPRTLWTSIDGTAWTRRDAFGYDIFGLQAAGGTAYAMGWYCGLKYSTDHGATWRDAALPLNTAWTTHRLASSPDGTLLLWAQAMDEIGSPAVLLVSTDGRTWARETRAEPVAQLNDLTYGAGRFFAVGNAASIRGSNSIYPGNSAPVVTITSAPPSANARQPVHLAATATDADGDPMLFSWDCGPPNPVMEGAEITPSFSFGGPYTITLRVSDGHGGLTTVSRSIAITDPARTWSQRASGTTATLTSLAAGPNQLVAAGDNGTVLTSPDGTTWTTRSLPDWGGNIYLRSVTWDGTRFIVAGKDYDNAWVSVLYTSSNGSTWTRRYKSTTPDTWLQSVASSGPVGVAVGINGQVLRSTDGTTWAPVAVGALGSANATGIAWGGGRFALVVGVANAAKVFTSPDGLTWTDRSPGTNLGGWQYFDKIAWLQDRFVASGWYSRLCVSTDWGQTFTSGRLGNESLPAMAAGDGIWLAAGRNLDDQTQVDLLSLNGADWASYPAPASVARNAAAFFNHTFVTVGDGGAIWQTGALAAPSGWSAWLAEQFPGGGLDALPEADPDNDGLSNRLEYALGRIPVSSAGSDGAAALPVGVLSAGRLALRLNMPENAPADAVYSVQGSASLVGSSWTTLARKTGAGAWQWLGGGASHLAVAAPASGRVVVEVGRPDSSDTASRYFLRLALEAP